MDNDHLRAVVIIGRLAAAQTHLGRAMEAVVRGGTAHDGIREALSAITEAEYWLGHAEGLRAATPAAKARVVGTEVERG